jgi:hypothetical protein
MDLATTAIVAMTIMWCYRCRLPDNQVIALSLPSSSKVGLSTTSATNDIPLFHHHSCCNNAIWDRRQWIRSTTAAVASSLLCQSPLLSLPALAGGLLQFPVTKAVPLKNKYHLMRAGTSELEYQGIYSTNPLFLTNRENQMHVKGQQQVKRALQDKLPSTQLPTVVYHSLAANGMDTGDLLARELNLGRDRLLPEFTYLDQRGIGLWDSSDVSIVQPALWALDEMEAGSEGFGGRPPANEDGTPNETLHDQFIRLRQFLSLQESRTSGETILIIFPDGTGPALLSCMIAGIPFNKVHVLELMPGELRLDVTPESITAWYQQNLDNPDYLATIQDGKEKLAMLRQKQKDNTLQEWINLKDNIAEQEQQRLEHELKEKKAMERRQQEVANAQANKKINDERQRQSEEKRQQQQQRAMAAKQQVERAAATTVPARAVVATTTNSDSSTFSDVSFDALVGTGGLGLLGLAILAIGTTNNDKGSMQDMMIKRPVSIESLTNATVSMQPINVADVAVAARDTAADTGSSSSNGDKSLQDYGDMLMKDVPQTLTGKPHSLEVVNDDIVVGDAAMDVQRTSPTEREFNIKMERAKQQLQDALAEAAQVKTQKKKTSMCENGNITTPRPSNTQNYRYTPKSYSDDDDGANDWLKVLVEIRDNDDVVDEAMDDLVYPTTWQEDAVLVYGDVDYFQNCTTSLKDM